MSRVSYEDLISGARYLRASYPGSPDSALLTLGLSCQVLGEFLGREWVNQAVFHQHEEVSSRNEADREFLGTDDLIDEEENMDEEQNRRQYMRVWQLAEYLYNLQGVEGFDRVVQGVKSDTLQSYHSELEFPAHLAHCGIDFRFNPESGEKGEDYDVDILTPERSLALEIKTKLGKERPTDDKVFRACTSKLSSLPDGKPGVIGVKLPTEWVESGMVDESTVNRTMARLEGMASAGKGGTGVLGVVFAWDTFRHIQVDSSGTYKSALFPKFRAERNDECDFSSPGYVRVLEMIEQSRVSRDVAQWTNLRQVAVLS